MALKFDSVEVTKIGGLVTENRFGMVRVSVVIHDDASDAFISMDCELPVQYLPTETVASVHAQALAMLRAALAIARDRV